MPDQTGNIYANRQLNRIDRGGDAPMRKSKRRAPAPNASNQDSPRSKALSARSTGLLAEQQTARAAAASRTNPSRPGGRVAGTGYRMKPRSGRPPMSSRGY